jgi:hypothetical protein
MSNEGSQARKCGEYQKRILGWDDAIADAKRRLKEIEFALKVFEQGKKSGEPWPGEGNVDVAVNQ